MPDEIWVLGYKGKFDPVTLENSSELQTSYTRTDIHKAEIKKLRERLEVSDKHNYDGIESRDETIKLLEREIEKLREQTQWQPIEPDNCPDFGQTCLFYGYGARNEWQMIVGTVGSLSKDAKGEITSVQLAGVTFRPVYWMPLPKPPKD